ncbi:transglycosylase domain-containing protein [Halalkalibacter alkaliphilus]|uniref:Transglycosylase domain-containing protein n=1 Tax=Halalkalibacter alkaliphilus TaxID=2917993 RepID=A0A9X2CTS1_9BACI|nr:transglycosylase domain-containing protein [Halalkalibacter alkaliphilus]MCL7747824.1 transglycosylase domain-containing protein [Halalkalibacter alkaliphilus]
MNYNESSFIEKLKRFPRKLHELKVFRKIGITYQVFWNLFLVFLLVGCMTLFFVGGTAAGYFAALVKDEPLRTADEMRTQIYDYEETSVAYFADDRYLGELPSDLERYQVALEDISPHLKNAIIATEDEYFYEHEGIVPKAIMRATFQEFANSSLQTGGSTLTQQLIKNQILTSEVSFDRKATEILLAMRLEHFLDKDEILEAYLNIVPFGRNSSGRQIAGVQAAATGIFGVDASELSIPQAAYIAGLPQSPFGYTPFLPGGEVKENLDPSMNRMRTVLSRMHESGFITEDELADALAYDITGDFTERTPAPIEKYPYLTNEVLSRAADVLAEQMLNNSDQDLGELTTEELLEVEATYKQQARSELRNNGYHIHTTIDEDIYNAMQDAVKTDHLFGPEKNGQQEEVGAVLIENRTGAIKGFVGGREEVYGREFNRATGAYRQNGSTMKPLLAYAPALDIGAIQPGIVVPDTPTTYPGGEPLSNFDNSHQGLLSVRQSLARSRNIPAVRSFLMVPHEQSRETLQKLGFKLNSGEPYPSAPLGSTDYNVTVEQNTNAYATFANGGKYVESYMIERIETAAGDIIYEHEPTEVEVFSPQASYLTLDMLRDVLKAGGTASTLPGRLNFSTDWAGKTGTTSNTRDSWFVGTNPNVTLGVWIGYDRQEQISTTVNGLRSGPRTQQIWANIANAAHSKNSELMAPSERFARPDGIVSRSICSLTGLLPSSICQQAGLVTTDLFDARYVPNQTDDSLDSARYVTINGKNFLALSNTPSEFTQEGVVVSDAIDGVSDISNYLPDNMKNLIPDKKAPDNGNTPGAVSGVTLNSDTLSWSKHSDNDIVGYRIYRAENESTDYRFYNHVRGNESTSFNVNGKNYSYYVTAVDAAGRESSASSIVEGKNYSPEPKPEVKEEEEEEEEEKEDKKDKKDKKEKEDEDED